MKLSEETKRLIHKEFDSFKVKMYKGLSPEDRKKYGMVYTPADISIRMIEKFTCTNEEFTEKTILDPCCGSGNLLVACLIAGADAAKIYGNELNRKMVRLARRRIRDLCENIEEYPNIKNRDAWIGNENGGKFNSNKWHVHVGDATNKICLTYFCSDYPKKLSDNLRDLYGFAKKHEQVLLDRVTSDNNYDIALPDEGLTTSDLDEASAVDSTEYISEETKVNESCEQFNKQYKQQKVTKQKVDTTKKDDNYTAEQQNLFDL